MHMKFWLYHATGQQMIFFVYQQISWTAAVRWYITIIRLIIVVHTDNAEPLPVPDVLLLCVYPFVEELPGVNGNVFLLIHAAVK